MRSHSHPILSSDLKEKKKKEALSENLHLLYPRYVREGVFLKLEDLVKLKNAVFLSFYLFFSWKFIKFKVINPHWQFPIHKSHPFLFQCFHHTASSFWHFSVNVPYRYMSMCLTATLFRLGLALMPVNRVLQTTVFKKKISFSWISDSCSEILFRPFWPVSPARTGPPTVVQKEINTFFFTWAHIYVLITAEKQQWVWF